AGGLGALEGLAVHLVEVFEDPFTGAGHDADLLEGTERETRRGRSRARARSVRRGGSSSGESRGSFSVASSRNRLAAPIMALRRSRGFGIEAGGRVRARRPRLRLLRAALSGRGADARSRPTARARRRQLWRK